MRLFLILALALSACAKSSEPDKPTCQTYPSAYVVRYPDGSVHKSGIEACGSVFKVTSLDGAGATFENEILMIRLQDASGYYFTSFSGDQ